MSRPMGGSGLRTSTVTCFAPNGIFTCPGRSHSKTAADCVAKATGLGFDDRTELERMDVAWMSATSLSERRGDLPVRDFDVAGAGVRSSWSKLSTGGDECGPKWGEQPRRMRRFRP